VSSDIPLVESSPASPREAQRIAILLQELCEREERFRIAFEHAPNPMALFNSDNRCIAANRGLCTLLGYDETKLLGQHLSELVFGNDVHSVVENFRALRTRPEEPRLWECRLCHSDGHPIWCQVSVSESPVWQDGQNPCILEARDLTKWRALELDRLKAEEQARRRHTMEAVGRLAGGVAHQFNNLFGVVLNHLDFAEKRAGDPDALATHLGAMRQATLQSCGLVRQLMIFGRCDISPPDVQNLSAGIEALAPRLRERLGRTGECIVDAAPNLRPIWMAASHLEQLVEYLVLNARDAMPTGGKVTLRTENRDVGPDDHRVNLGVRPGHYVQLVVEDTGEGMSEETRARAFEPFFSTRRGGHSGLGLSMVWGIVEEAGGFSHIESAPGAGTRVEILFPATESRSPDQAPSRDEASLQGHGESVLVVEDQPALRDLTCHLLRENGYEAWSVEDAEAALHQLMSEPRTVDLLLTDVILPGLSGADLAGYVRTLRPTARVLFMSGRADEHLGRQRLISRELAVLQKPFDAEQLLSAVRTTLDRLGGPSP
jgi:PAS domain S-box-containing protein